MQVVNLFRASVFNSSSSAFILATYNTKYMDFSTKIINVKNENAHCLLINLSYSNKASLAIEHKIEKYKALLYMLENISGISPSSSRTD